MSNLPTGAQSTIHTVGHPQATYTITAQKPSNPLWKKCIPYISLATVPIASWMCAPVGLCILAGTAISMGIKRHKKKSQAIPPPKSKPDNETVFESPEHPFSGYAPPPTNTKQQLHSNQNTHSDKASLTPTILISAHDTDLILADTAAARQQGYIAYEQHDLKISKQIYSLCASSADILERYQLPIAEYQHYVGSPLQHIIHRECITIIDRTARLEPLRTTALEEHIIEFVDIGRECNQSGYTNIALKSLDVCWGFLDCSYAIIDGMADGVIDLAESVMYIGQHPIRATKEFIRSAAETGECFALLLDEIKNLAETKGGQLLGFDINTDRADAFIEQCTIAATTLAHAIKNNPYDAIKQTSKQFTQAYLTGKILGCVQKVINSATTQAPHYFDTIKSLVDNSPTLHQAGAAAISIPHVAASADVINTIPLAIIYNAMNHGSEKYGTSKSNDKKYDSKKETQNNHIPNKHPHGKYEDAPYHHQNSKGKKNPAPKDGQMALDHSVGIPSNHPNKMRRVGTSNGEIVVLDQTSPGLYHGHVRTWQEIEKSPSMINIRNVLLKYNLVDKFGNIL